MSARPQKSYQKLTIERKVRIEPQTDVTLQVICRDKHITVSDGIRRGIDLFIKEELDGGRIQNHQPETGAVPVRAWNPVQGTGEDHGLDD